jgi:hypothetical protein
VPPFIIIRGHKLVKYSFEYLTSFRLGVTI